MQCPRKGCSYRIPPHVDRCPVCNSDVGSPNVRASKTEEEVVALRQRYNAAIRDARKRDCRPSVLKFENEVKKSKAVICRSPSIARTLMESDNALYANYYHGVEAGMFMPRDNDWDSNRESADSRFFPHYHKDINFAALTLDDQGASGYGAVSLVLKSPMIGERASVFEENTLKFLMSRGVAIGDNLPKGYRAPWDNRAQLAATKLASKIDASTKFSDYPRILLEKSDKTDSDFIEVHIFGKIHRRTVEKVVVDKPGKLRREDLLIARSIKEICKGIGTQYEVR